MFSSVSPAMAFLAQDRLLQCFLKGSIFEKHTTYKYGVNYVQIRSKDSQQRQVVVDRKNKKPTLVLLHGYGLGLGFFYDNYDHLAHNFDRVIAVDWPGMGCSARDILKMKKISGLSNAPKRWFNTTTSREAYEKALAHQVTEEFVDSLEELRVQEGLTDFVLAGHSLGGFLSAKYALKYPKHIKGLVLISPVGVTNPPPVEQHAEPGQLDWRMRLIKNLWEMNFTPQSVVRIAGSHGPKLVKNAISIDGRFSKQFQSEELQVLSDYFYHITALPGSGEYALNSLLQPIFTKPESESEVSEANSRDSPSSSRREKRKRRGYSSGVYAREPLEQELSSLRMPILLMYGDKDWLYYPTASDSIDLWNKSGGRAELKIINNAGHHLYMDNSKDFNNSVVDWVRNTL
eukprot:gene6905-7630_t